MSDFAARVAALTGADEGGLERLAGGDLSLVFKVRRADGRCSVAKSGPAIAIEAAMLRAIAAAGVPAPAVEAEHGDVLLIEHVDNDRAFSPAAWRSIGAALQRLHGRTGEGYGWPDDYRIASVALDNRATDDWPSFWVRQRLVATARLLDRPWRERVERLSQLVPPLLPLRPQPALLHGDLWSGNILVSGGELAALIDPACYYGHGEVDLAMLTLFDQPDPAFWQAYGPAEPGWQQRQPIYQLFPALVHLRLFGGAYSGLVDRLLSSIGE